MGGFIGWWYLLGGSIAVPNYYYSFGFGVGWGSLQLLPPLISMTINHDIFGYFILFIAVVKNFLVYWISILFFVIP